MKTTPRSTFQQSTQDAMGAWGNRNFDNDAALDFVGDFTDDPSTERLEETFTTVIELGEENEYIEVDEASAALAAAELVAAKLGKPTPDFPEELQRVLPTVQRAASLQKLARKAVKQVVKKSELQELWAESDESAAWQAVQADLLTRLQ